jgi:N-acyl-D-aspartate/D-glutamate deacylase
VLFGLQASLHPFGGLPSYRAIARLPIEERVQALRDPDMKRRVLDEAEGGTRGILGGFDRMFVLGDPPDYEPAPESSVTARAAALGRAPADLAYDLLLEDDGRALLYYPLHNWVDGSLDTVRAMLADEHLVPGLADGGAHVGTICDGSYPTTLLSYWARDRADGLPLEWVVRRQCRDTAETVGLLDRGLITPGMRADVNVIDHAALRLRAPYLAFDLPAGGKRLLQRAEGYLHTFVRGIETYRDGEAVGPLPGRLVRGRTGSRGAHG